MGNIFSRKTPVCFKLNIGNPCEPNDSLSNYCLNMHLLGFEVMAIEGKNNECHLYLQGDLEDLEHIQSLGNLYGVISDIKGYGDN